MTAPEPCPAAVEALAQELCWEQVALEWSEMAESHREGWRNTARERIDLIRPHLRRQVIEECREAVMRDIKVLHDMARVGHVALTSKDVADVVGGTFDALLADAGQEQVREYRCDAVDDNRYCLDCCKKAEDSAAPTGPHQEGKDGTA